MYRKCLSRAELFPRILDKLYLPNWGAGQAGCLVCQTRHLQVEVTGSCSSGTGTGPQVGQ